MMSTARERNVAASNISPALIVRVRSEFLEMPGLRLTLRQAATLWGLDGEVSERVLARLLDSGLLRQTTDGAYVRQSGR